ncbi:hypothetical protein [Streptomyces ardesiacus]|uniref:hypothetical protein n=1 Tax=Streptomyces ardesiacus TaxID=285564 RepID=UPI00201EB508|nr:hypothetical protein [Streptomyces ardesiacus]MCL7370415.1 hypothetical protein [Streptomyces ardesiacus]
MTASRVPAPDMTGLTDDWQRLKSLRDASDRRPDQESDPESDATTPRRHETTTARDHDATDDGQDQEHADVQEDGPGDPEPRARRRTGGRRPAPRAADAVALTVRFEPQESDEVDDFLREIRRAAGRRRLDKAEAVRELLRLAREHEPTRKALIRRLR